MRCPTLLRQESHRKRDDPIGHGQRTPVGPLAAHRLTNRFEEFNVVLVLDRLGREEAPVPHVFRKHLSVRWPMAAGGTPDFAQAQLAHSTLDCFQIRQGVFPSLDWSIEQTFSPVSPGGRQQLTPGAAKPALTVRLCPTLLRTIS